jgi:hypothetical protein
MLCFAARKGLCQEQGATCTRHKLYQAQAVPGTSCTRHKLYQAQAVPGTTCTRHNLYQAQAVPGTTCTRHNLYQAQPVPGTSCTRHKLYQAQAVPGQGNKGDEGLCLTQAVFAQLSMASLTHSLIERTCTECPLPVRRQLPGWMLGPVAVMVPCHIASGAGCSDCWPTLPMYTAVFVTAF